MLKKALTIKPKKPKSKDSVVEIHRETPHSMFWECDLETGEMTTISLASETFLGYKYEQWINEKDFWITILHDDDRDSVVTNCLLLAKSVTNYELSYRMIAANGGTHWIKDIVHVILENGKPKSLKGIFLDITSSKYHESNLEQSENRYRQLIETMNEGIIQITKENKIEVVNDKIAQLLGYTKDDLFKLKIDDIVYEDDLNTLKSELKRRSRGVSTQYEMRLTKKTGEQIWCLVTACPLFEGRSKNIIGSFAAITDITKRKEVEAEVLKNEQSLKEAQRISKLGNWNLEFKTNTLRWSDEVFNIFEIKKDNKLISYNKFLSYIHKNDLDYVSEAVTISIDKKSDFNIVHRLSLKKGAVKFVNLKGETFYDNKGIAVRLFGTIQDITEQIQVENELKKREEQLMLIANNINEVVYNVTYDEKGKSVIKYISPQVESIFGFTPEEYQKHLGNIKDFYHPDDVSIIVNLIDQVKVHKKAITATYRFKHRKHNAYVWIEESIVPQFDANGKHIGNFGTARDISQRLRSELLQTVSYNISKVANRRIMDLSSLSEAIHAELSKVIETKNFYIALYMEDQDQIFFPFFVDEKDESLHKEVRDFSDGLTEYVINSKKPLFLKRSQIEALIKAKKVNAMGKPSEIYLGIPLKTEGKTIGVLAVQSYENPNAYSEKDLELLKFVSRQIAAVIEKHQAQENLARSEEYFRSITENASDLITILNEFGIIQYESQSHEKVLGYKPQELIGNNVFDYLHPDDIFKIKKFLINQVNSNVPEDAITYRFRHKNGQYRYLESSTKNLLLAPTVKGFVINSRDITERVLTQAKLENTNKELEMFIYKASHDLKGPLASIIGLANIAVDTVKDASAMEFLSLILNSTSRLDSILNDLLRISKTTQGKVYKRKINVEELVIDIVNSLKHAEHAKGINFNYNIEPGVELASDREILSSILQNIIDNAVKYRRAEDDAFVDIIVTENTGNVSFQIRDNGNGIPYNLQSKVFDMFFRATESSKGTGLGLYMVKKSVEKLNGAINLRSIPEEGSTFTVILPCS